MTLGESRPSIDNTPSTKPKWKIIEDGLEDAVGYMNPGRKLPSEKVFMEQYNLGSRDPVRQAFDSLRKKGLIETKRGREGGSFVREKNSRNKKESEPEKNKVKGTRHQQVASTIFEEILRGDYGPGDKIPTIPELMNKFGFSRNTVRLGIQILAEREIVQSKQGSGTEVCKELPSDEILNQLGDSILIKPEEDVAITHPTQKEVLPKTTEEIVIYEPPKRILDSESQNAIREVRRNHRISQSQVAALIPGFNQMTLNRIENGTRKTSREDLVSLISALQELHVPFEDPLMQHLIGIYSEGPAAE